ncbi:outer membrane lipoprotein carrier protein LolA [Phycisphaera mikurensis]|uniref:Outer membrane lipoprotein carrier protein LolA n=1 Tax=Phycisphaera mikurensis (strain NBRC 102666 / KCTC 22515 / FYK2301M01) TaxID=1142394 RepID=I0IJ07_PHYMF|nr:outer membrane lipoprotein carrier protein LolA [Phycisphaera mikurensis]MBB6443092.1 hypothetical protein [Phycisphaera mikurensis]BAM05245.1 hypothetical protein PSMK_30860 [Phycisphaera mikurensis NBRC 102666]
MRTIALLLSLLLAAAPARAQKPEPAMAALLTRLDANRPDLADACMTAAFERRKVTPLLRKPLASSGVLTASGGALRWETLRPRPGTTVIAGGEMRIVYPDEKRVEVYDLSVAGGMGFGPASPLSELTERFEVVEAEPPAWAGADAADPLPPLIGLRLVPRDAAVAEQLRSIGLGIEEATGAVRLLETVDGDGSSTSYRFASPEVKPEPCVIEPPAPEGFEVVRPYGG